MELVPRVLGSLLHEVAGKITFRHASPTFVLADPLRLRQILRNLVMNAHRHGGPDIGLSIEARRSHAFLRVTDNGPGIPVDHRQATFEYGDDGSTFEVTLPRVERPLVSRRPPRRR